MNNENNKSAPKRVGAMKIKDLKVAIPFAKLRISKYNRGYDMPADPDYVTLLAEDIDRNGLIHPLILVPWQDGTGYDIVAGANRMRALEGLRGKESGLADDEFVVRYDLTDSDPRLFELSVAENQQRRESSPYELAVYVTRIIEEEKIDQIKVAKVMKVPRPTINRLLALNTWWAELPDSWQRDLKTSARVASDNAPVITFSHWYMAAAAFENSSGPELRKLLDRARDEEWSTRELKRQLDEFDPTADSAAQVEGAGAQAEAEKPAAAKSPASIDPIATVNRAYKSVGKAFGLLDGVDGVEQVVQLLREAAELINQRLGLLKDEKAMRKAAKKAERAKGKAAKGPKAKDEEGTEG